jgi:hypothetical protein
MRRPIVTEIMQRREPVVRDTFIDDLHTRRRPPRSRTTRFTSAAGKADVLRDIVSAVER